MNVGTEAEVMQMLSDARWNSGIKVDGTNLYYDNPESSCIEMAFPDWPGRAAYFSSRAARLGTSGDETHFQGALLWITYSEIGNLSPIGWRMIERMRLSFGENRPLQTARIHFFRSDELLDLTAFLLPCFIFGWDAYLVPFANNDCFVHVSHDEYWGVVCKTQETHQKLLAELTDLNPAESPRMQRRFCWSQSS